MHTTKVKFAGGFATVHHNSDWSGEMIVTEAGSIYTTDREHKLEVHLPVSLLVEIAARIAFDSDRDRAIADLESR